MCGTRACAWGAGVEVPGRPQPVWAGLLSPVPSPSPLLTWLWQKPQQRGPGGKRRRPRTGRGQSAEGPWWATRRQWVAAGRSAEPADADKEARAPAEGKDSEFPGAARAAVRRPERRHSAPWRRERRQRGLLHRAVCELAAESALPRHVVPEYGDRAVCRDSQRLKSFRLITTDQTVQPLSRQFESWENVG